MRGDTTYAAPDKDKAAAEGGDGVFSYAATTTIVGVQHNKHGRKPGGENKGDVYTISKKKTPEMGHKAGPQGDMYVLKPWKVSEISVSMCCV